MTYVAVSPTESQVQVALRAFLLMILPAGTDVVEGQDNNVAEPEGNDFVVMTPILRSRLMTNVNQFFDFSFVGSISGSVMNVVSASGGALHVGSQIFSAGTAQGTIVVALGTGTGGEGTYTVSVPQAVPQTTLYAGYTTFLNQSQLTIQLDVHGPNSAENSQLIGTLFRDAYATDTFAVLNPNVTPLYADDPKQIPFVNAEQNVETRWVVDCVIQVDQTTIVTGQQFTSQFTIPTKPVPNDI